MDNNVMQLSQSSILTTSVKPPSPARANNCLTVCRREEVITRCDSDQTPTRCASSAGQCSNVRRLRLYPRRPCIQWQLSPISERDECSDNITTSLEVSKNDTETSGNSVQYLMTTPSCSFRISAPSYYKVKKKIRSVQLFHAYCIVCKDKEELFRTYSRLWERSPVMS